MKKVFDEYTHFVLTLPLARVTLFGNEYNAGYFVMFADGTVETSPHCTDSDGDARDFARRLANETIERVLKELAEKENA